MKREELEGNQHILAMKVGDGIGTEIDAGNDNEALMLIGAAIVATVKFLDEENREKALDSLRNLLDAYPDWSSNPEFNKPWEEA